MKNEKRTSKRDPVHSDIEQTVGTGKTAKAVRAGSGPSAGAGHGAAAPALQQATGGGSDLSVTPTDTNPSFPQGVPPSTFGPLPLPPTVPNQPWQMPPGSAIPI